MVRHEDLPVFDNLIYKRGTLLDKLLRRGSDLDYLCRHGTQNLGHGINQVGISTNQKYSNSCTQGKFASTTK